MLDEHHGYVSDAVRLERFRTAIAKILKAGDTVADLGCGTGILGLLCLQAGASHVLAIDDGPMLEIARESLRRAGLSDKTTFIRGKSSRIELPESVDLVICDHVGYFGFDYGIIEFLRDAKQRFLKPGGMLVPAKIRLNLASVCSKQGDNLASAWQGENIPAEYRWLNTYSINNKHAVDLDRGDVLSSPALLGEIDLNADNPAFFTWEASLHCERDGTTNGLAGWFDCELTEGVWMTNSPLAQSPIRRPQAFFPIGQAVQIKVGDTVKVRLMARPAEHLIAWTVEFPATGQRFSHSTWQGMVLSPDDLLRSNPGRVPRLSQEGEARLTVLGYCDGKRTAKAIEQAILRDHPDLFPSAQEISNFVLRVLGKDTA